MHYNDEKEITLNTNDLLILKNSSIEATAISNIQANHNLKWLRKFIKLLGTKDSKFITKVEIYFTVPTNHNKEIDLYFKIKCNYKYIHIDSHYQEKNTT